MQIENTTPSTLDYYRENSRLHPEESVRQEKIQPVHLGIRTSDPRTLQSILDATPVAIQIVSLDGFFIDCNTKTLELFRAFSREDVVGKPPGILSPKTQPDGISSAESSNIMITRAFSGETVTFPWEHKRLDGTMFPAIVTLNPIQYNGTTCLMASVIDISDQVSQSNAISSLIQEAPFSVLTLTPEYEVIDVNPAYLTITGLSHEQAKIKKFSDYSILHREGGTIADAKTSKRTVRGRFVCDFGSQVKILDYTYIPVLNHLNEVIQFFHIMVDQTGIISKNHEYDVMLSECPAGILTLDPSGTILTANSAYAEITGTSIKNLLTMNIRDFTCTARSGPTIHDCVRDKKPVKGTVTGQFGSNTRVLEYTYIPIPDVSGTIQKIIALYNDVTPVQHLVRYLNQSVESISGYLIALAEGNTAFTPVTLDGDQYTRSAHQNVSRINEAINHARESIERIVQDSNGITNAALTGNLSYRTDPTVHTGNFRAIIEGMNKTLDATITPVKEAMRVSKEYADYNFVARFNPDIQVCGDWDEFRRSLDKTGIEVSHALHTLAKKVVELSASIEEANSSVQEITSGTQEITQSMTAMAGNTGQADLALGQILKAMDDLNATVGSIAKKSDTVAVSSTQANEVAQTGIDLANKSVSAMSEITSSAEQVDVIVRDINGQMNEIGKIVLLISDIASQTNLLSLNAAIEAARAGEAGRGFAVVASEVKSLAQDSRRSAETISELIKSLQAKARSAGEAMGSSIATVHEGSDALRATVDAFTRIAETITEINVNIMDVAASAEEQAASVEEITARMQEVSLLTHSTSEEVSSSASAISDTSVSLDQICQVINSIVHIGDGVHTEINRFTV